MLATDATTTVALFIYHELQWGREAQVGFNAGDGLASFSIPGALTFQTLSLNGRSNVREPGVFVYPINSEFNLIFTVFLNPVVFAVLSMSIVRNGMKSMKTFMLSLFLYNCYSIIS